jgi:DNA (cytosine-5)-methyltransferase 1
MYTSIDLFAGPGGLCTGFKWGGIKPLIAVEWSYWTVQTYASTHNAEILNLSDYLGGNLTDFEIDKIFSPSDKTVLIFGDINLVSEDLIFKLLKNRYSRSSVDIVTGGAPCESFSLAGERKDEDDRDILFLNVLRIAKAVNSKMFLFENVKGLFSKKTDGIPGKMYDSICEKFQEKVPGKTSYFLASVDKKTVLLKASDYGVPQSRERIFLLGINREFEDARFSYPQKTHGIGNKNYVTVEQAIMDLPIIASGETNNIYSKQKFPKYNKEQKEYLNWMRGLRHVPSHIEFSETTLSSHTAPGHLLRIKERIKLIRIGENQRTAFLRLASEGLGSMYRELFPKQLYGARNRRLKPDEPSFTVTSHCLDEMIHPFYDRGLTPREVARLQSFPDWYQFRGPFVRFHGSPEQDQYEQIGDAIPPLLAYSLSLEITKTLEEIKEKYDR